MYIRRKIEEELLSQKDNFPVITITGPRQSGKTTLVKHLFEDYVYINLEDPQQREVAVFDPMSILTKGNKIIIDEVQRVPDLISHIQVIVDGDQNRRFVLTGSNNFILMEKISQSLAGRTLIAKLLPLSFEEIDVSNADTDELIFRGFYPAIYAKHQPPNLVYQNYFETYVQKDLRQLINVKNLALFQKFVRLVAGRIGSELNYSDLSNQLGISVMTVKQWFSILEASFIIFLLPPFFANISKRLTKKPKVYFYDVGLASYLLGIEDVKEVERDPLRGALFENLVVAEVLKARYNRLKESNLNFYRDKNGLEMDLLVDKRTYFILAEIKAAKTFNTFFLRSFKRFEKVFPDKKKQQYLIYDGQEFDLTDVKVLNFRNLNKILPL